MKNIISRLRSKCGESLIETMCSILIFTLASIILLTMISSASKINRETKNEEGAIADELEVAEMQSASGERGTVTITYGGKTPILVDVYFYSLKDSGTLYSYKTA